MFAGVVVPIIPADMSLPKPKIDSRTGAVSYVREWNGKEYEAMRANISKVDELGLMTVQFAQDFKS